MYIAGKTQGQVLSYFSLAQCIGARFMSCCLRLSSCQRYDHQRSLVFLANPLRDFAILVVYRDANRENYSLLAAILEWFSGRSLLAANLKWSFYHSKQLVLERMMIVRLFVPPDAAFSFKQVASAKYIHVVNYLLDWCDEPVRASLSVVTR